MTIDLTTLRDGLPDGPWIVCGADRGICKCGQVWTSKSWHIATAHHVSQAGPHDMEAQEVYPDAIETQKAVARAIAAIPEMLDEIERLSVLLGSRGLPDLLDENERLRAIHQDGGEMTTRDDIIDQIDTAIELRSASLPLLSEIRTEFARLRAENAEIREALVKVRAIIVEAAQTGFNCHDGDWAERLYASQADSKRALTKTEPK